MAKTKKEKSFLEEILDKYGEDVAIRKYKDGVPAVSTGSLAIDVSTGIGGVPKGRFTEIYGPDGSGKTTLLLSIAREAVKAGERVLYIDTENSLDYAYASEILGKYMKTDKEFLVIQPLSAEDSFELALKGMEAGYTFVCFDSVAALSPAKELEEGMSKQQIGLAPRLTSKFIRKVIHKVKDEEIAFVYSNQVRATIGSYFKVWSTPAGYALKHYTSLRIYLSKGKDILVDDKAIGNYVNFIIKKNKVGKPFRQATTNIIWGKGIDYYRDALSFSSLLGIIKSRGSYFAFKDQTIGNKPGIINTVKALEKDQELLDKIVKLCYNIAGSKQMSTKIEPERKNGTTE